MKRTGSPVSRRSRCLLKYLPGFTFFTARTSARTFLRPSKTSSPPTPEIGVAKASFFPDISLTGSVGGANGSTSVFSTAIGLMFSPEASGANITQPIFEGGQLRGNLHLAESQQRQELIAYKEAIQGAFRDVSDALIAYDKFHSVRVAQEITAHDLQETVNTSLERYRGGIATYLEVLDAQRSLFNAELTLAQGSWQQNIRALSNCTRPWAEDGSHRGNASMK